MRAATLLLTLATLCPAAPRSAARTAEAQAHYERGLELWRANRFSEAAAAFLQSNALDPHETTMINVARSFHGGGDFEQARAWYRRVAEQASAAENRAAADTALVELATHGYLAVNCGPPAVPIRVGEKQIGACPRAGVYLEPGRYRVTLRTETGAERSLQAVVREGMRTEHYLDLGEAESLEAGAPELALSRYRLARELYRNDDLENAAVEFRAGLDIFPESRKLAYDLGRTLERLGRWSEALEAYRRYLEVADDAADRPAVRRLAAGLQARIEAAWPQLLVTSTPPGARVFIDDADHPAGSTPLTISAPKGEHVVRLVLEGYRQSVQAIELVPERRKVVVATLEPETPTPARVVVIRPLPPAPPPAAEGSGWRAATGWTLVALGLGGAGAGTWFLLEAQKTSDATRGLNEDVEEEAAEHARLTEDLDEQQRWMWVGYGAGAGLLVTGVVVLAWPGGDTDETALTPFPGGMGLRARW